jgi:hypothetical protein
MSLTKQGAMSNICPLSRHQRRSWQGFDRVRRSAPIFTAGHRPRASASPISHHRACAAAAQQLLLATAAMPLNLPVGARQEMGLRKRAPAPAAASSVPSASTTPSSDGGGPSKKPVSPLMAVANLFDGLTENQQMVLLAG